MVRIAFALLAFVSFVAEGFAQCTISENGYALRVKITIDNTKVEGTASHADFPVLISHTDPNMRSTTNGGYVENVNGYDIIFTNSSGTQIDHRLVSYNASTGAIEAWVEVPSLSTAADTDIYIYFGKEGVASDPSTAGTFAGNYKAVWPLDENPSGTVSDYTSNSNTMSSSGSMTSGDEVSAMVGNGLDFDGTDDYVTRSYDSDFDFGTNSFTVSGWIKTAGSTGGTPTDFAVRINNDNDDVEEEGTGGAMYYSSSDLEIVDDPGTSDRDNQTIGLRFNSITIPQGATINSATIEFTADGDRSDPCDLTIAGSDEDDAGAIPATDYYLSSGIAETSASVSWSPGGWSDGNTYTTSDITSIVQEIVNRSGWTSGNSMLFTIQGSGADDEVRRAVSHDGNSSEAPYLEINYGGASDMTILSRYDDDQGFKLYMDGSGKVHFAVDDDGTWDPDFVVSSTSAYDDDDWHYVTGVKYDDDSIALFIDGNHIDGAPTSIAAAPVSAYVVHDDDDAEEEGVGEGDEGSMDLGSGDLEMEDDTDSSYPHPNQTVGVRFQNIAIPPGTSIDSAFIRFHADENNSSTTNLTLHGHDTCNAVAFSSDDYDITSRTFTSSSVAWSNVEAWSDQEYYNSPDIKTIVEEILERGDWTSGNAMAFFIQGSQTGSVETRNAFSHDGSDGSDGNGSGEDPPQLLIYTGATSLSTLSSDSAPLSIGSDEPTNGKYFDGIIDEVRIAGTAWDAGYIATEFNNVSSPSTFYSTTANAPDTAYYWTGATSTDWNTASNWSFNKVPSEESTVIIPDVANDPALGADAEVNTLYIKLGAIFNSGSYNLTVYDAIISDGTYNTGTGTVTYNLAGDQDICHNSFNNLVLGGSGAKTLTSSIDIDGSLTVSGTAQLDVSGSDYTINLSGNWNVSSTHADPFAEQGGTVILDGAGAQSISHSGTGGSETFNNLTIDKSAGVVSLSHPITIAGTLDFTGGGKIALGTSDLTIGDAGSITGYGASGYVVTDDSGLLRQEGIGSASRTGSVVFPVGTTSTSFTPVTIDNSTGTADRFDVRVCNQVYDDGNCSGGNAFSSMVVNKTWHISEGTTGGSDAAITLQWNSADELVFDHSSCLISHFKDGSWGAEMAATAAAGSDPYMLTATGINDFSPFGVGENPSLLPVELLYFRGTYMGDSVLLTWSTATETNNDYFALERSSNGLDFKTIASIDGAGTSKSTIVYSYSDKTFSGLGQYYRLRQTDFDGQFEYFRILYIETAPWQKPVMVYPNPATDMLHISGTLMHRSQISYALYDLLGNALFSNQVVADGHFDASIDVSRYAPGIYWVKIENLGHIYVTKIVVTNG
jgi:hypothetical protein